jgi:hypothetical protein
MKNNLPRYTMRINKELLGKIHYVADYEGRTLNRELEQLVKKRIETFEQEHGIIKDSDSID